MPLLPGSFQHALRPEKEPFAKSPFKFSLLNFNLWNLPRLPRATKKLFLASLLLLTFSLLSFKFSTASAQTAPNPQPCQNAILDDDKLTDNYITNENGDPPGDLFFTASRSGRPGQNVTVQVNRTFTVDFSNLQAIFGPANSNYLEGKYQDQEHRSTNVVSLNSTDFNTYYGPGQKIAPQVMLDSLRIKYVNYVYNKPELAESANTISDTSGQNPKTVYELVQSDPAKLPPDEDPNTPAATPPSYGGDKTAWDVMWAKYWPKIPTSYNEFYEGKLEFRSAVSTPAINQIKTGIDSNGENSLMCPLRQRVIRFIMPEFFRTTAASGQLNRVIVPNAAQSGSNNMILQAANNTKNAVAGIVKTCVNAAINNPVSKALRKVVKVSLNLLTPSTANAQASVQIKDNWPDPVFRIRYDFCEPGLTCPLTSQWQENLSGSSYTDPSGFQIYDFEVEVRAQGNWEPWYQGNNNGNGTSVTWPAINSFMYVYCIVGSEKTNSCFTNDKIGNMVTVTTNQSEYTIQNALANVFYHRDACAPDCANGVLFFSKTSQVFQGDQTSPTDALTLQSCIPDPLETKKGIAPYCALPPGELLPGENCENKLDAEKLDNQNPNVVCTFIIEFSFELTLGNVGENSWDSCKTDPDTGVMTCTTRVAIWPDFRIPLLTETWNNTLYSDDTEPGTGSANDQVRGRPGVYSFFTPKSVTDDTLERLLKDCNPDINPDSTACDQLLNYAHYVIDNKLNPGFETCVQNDLLNRFKLVSCAKNFLEGFKKNQPGSPQEFQEILRQRFIGATDCSKEFVRDVSLKPIALQKELGISQDCNFEGVQNVSLNNPPPTGSNPASDNDCGKPEYLKYMQINPYPLNFGDPNCTFSVEGLTQEIRKRDPANERIWLYIALRESTYNPLAYNGSSRSGSAWGLFQMGHAAYPQYGIDYQIADPDTEYDRGDVEWPTQVFNAVSYNGLIGNSFCYWDAAYEIGAAKGCN